MNARAKRPQLTLDELHQLKWLLGGGLTLLAAWTVFYMDVEAWSLMIITTIATGATLLRPQWPARLPSLVHTLAFPAIVAFFVGDLWLRTEVLPAMVRLDMLLLLYRNISYRQRRDDLQVIVLGLFLIVVAGVLTVSLVFAAQLLVYTACALAYLFTITLVDAAPGAGRRTGDAERRTGAAPGWATHADWPALFRRLREVTDWRLVSLGGLLFAGVVAVSALLFMAIPRFQLENGMFLDRFISKKAKTGFSDTIRFGDVTEIQQDTSVALSVDVSDQSQIPAAPYWRMMVLDDYRDGTFRMSTLLRNDSFGPPRTFRSMRGHAPPRRGAAVYWTFYLESGISRYLPLFGPFSELVFREAQNFNYAGELNIVALREEPAAMTAYRVEGIDTSGVLRDDGFAQRWRVRATTAPGRFTRQAGLVLGPNAEADRATLVRLVREATGGEELSAPDFAVRVGGWLRSNHGYSLTPRIPANEGDPLVRWTASREAGHCELFAGAFVLLARTAGFPARVVTGFRGGTWNGYSGNFTIRNSDAHAWAEIFDAEAGAWRRTDPLEITGAAQAEADKGVAALAQRTDRSWAARFDSLRVFWYRRIVNFDQRTQTETLKAMKEATQRSSRRLREAVEVRLAAVKAWLTAPWDGRRLMKAGGVLAALAALGWLWREFGRGWWRELRRDRGGRGADPVRREAGRALARLRAHEQTEGAKPNVEWKRVIADLERLRFGPRESWPQAERVLRRARQALREARRVQSTKV